MSAHRVWPSVASGLLLAAGLSEERADFASAPRRLADEALVGPVQAVVERVVDGDTVDVRAHIWLGQTLTVRVRIDGVDAPETRSDCADERRRALAARDYLAKRLLDKEITLIGVVYDKFGGRVRAGIRDADGDVAGALIAEGLARPYRGERRQPWCETG
jgi:endonuclease YncB( thermonuclease family)